MGHGIPGVHGEVHDDLLQLRWIHQDGLQLRLRLEVQVDVLAQDALQHRFHAGDDPIEVDDPGLQHLGAAEGEELLRQRR